jgi:hypothetical protein
MGYKFQFVTLADFQPLNHAMFELAQAYNTPRCIGPSASTARPSLLPSLVVGTRYRGWWSASSMASSTAVSSLVALHASAAARVVTRCWCRFHASAAAFSRHARSAAPRTRRPTSSTTCWRACRIDSGSSPSRSLSDWH